jgi:predicted phage gp36 major capsid-like protein
MLHDALTNKPDVGFYSQRRTGGALGDSNAIKFIKFAAA